MREAWERALRRKKWVRWIVSWLPHRLTILARSSLRWEHAIVAELKQRWHRSLQLRVVSTTLVISATMIAVLGFFLTEQIEYGLETNAENSARAQTLAELNTARSFSGLTQEPDAQNALRFMTAVGQALQPTNGGPATYYVAVELNQELSAKPGFPQGFSSLDLGTPQPPTQPSTLPSTQPPTLPPTCGRRAARADRGRAGWQDREPAVLRSHHAYVR